jgi:hypothetical protein
VILSFIFVGLVDEASEVRRKNPFFPDCHAPVGKAGSLQ